MVDPANPNGREFCRVVLVPEPGCGEQKPQDLRVCFGRPMGKKIKQEEYQHSAEQASEQVEGGGAETHGEEEKFPFRSEDRERPRQRSMNGVDTAGICHGLSGAYQGK